MGKIRVAYDVECKKKLVEIIHVKKRIDLLKIRNYNGYKITISNGNE